MKKTTKKAVKPTIGRPSKYRPDFPERAYKYCLLVNATDQMLAELFEVDVDQIKEYKNLYPEFHAAIKMGKEESDFEVVTAFRKKATGYERVETTTYVNKKGEEKTFTNERHYPPDTAAGFIWLKNRHPQAWRDKQELTLDGGIGVAVLPIAAVRGSRDDWKKFADEIRKQRAIEHEPTRKK